MQTWQSVQKDFVKLLLNKDVNQDLDNKSLKGKADYYEAYGLYVQKVIEFRKNNFLSLKLKLNYSNKLHSIALDGQTNKERFKGSFDYYYSEDNLITNGKTKSSNAKGLGYGIDIEYIYNSDKLYVYLGAFNLASYIYWENVTLMHYDLDSQVIYKGDDGYNHYRPFGSGYYEYDVSYKQKLPQYYKSSVDYAVSNDFSVGYNFNIYDELQTHEPYVNYKYSAGRYKLGYSYTNEELIFAAYFKYLIFEVSNNIGPSNDMLRANLKISF